MKSKKSLGKAAVVASQAWKERDYWLNKLSGQWEKSHFVPTSRKPIKSEFRPGSIKIRLPGKLSLKLLQVSNNSDHRLHVILVSGLCALLNKHTGASDVIVGTPIYKQDVKGKLINTILTLRNRVETDMTFKQLLLQVNRTIMEAVEHQNYPVDILCHQLNLSGDNREFPLFDVVILLKNIHEKKYIEHISPNMVFSFLRTGSSIEGEVKYNPLKYDEDVVGRIVIHLTGLLEQVIFDVNIKISNIDILPEKEKKKLLVDFNDTETGYPESKTIHELFVHRVDQSPDNLAVVFNDKQLTYRKLNQKANQLAQLLRLYGLAPGSIVGIVMERSLPMIFAILGILKAGGAYLPIAPDYPEERIMYLLRDSNAGVLLTGKGLATSIEFGGKTIDPDAETISRVPTHNLSNVNLPHHLAYIIYTSGTTGRPKGVMIEHKNLVRLLFNDNFMFDFSSQDVWTMFHSYNFDFSVWEMYGALLYGGKLILVPKMAARDPRVYLKILKKQAVSVLNKTPSVFYHLINEEITNQEKGLKIKYVIFGGEALNPVKLKEWKKRYPKTRLVNMYGITETTVHTTYKEIGREEMDSDMSNIGKPLPTLKAYVLDSQLHLLPIGVAGEVCIGGEGVGRGYLNKPELTGKKYVDNPYKPGERLYKSGDLVKLANNGDMEYLGRIDHQIKIRGFRVELDEIKHQLLRQNDIKEAVVVVKQRTLPGAEVENKYICAYIVTGNGFKLEELRKTLSDTLPEYMIPSYFVKLPVLPLTPNGKLDIKALPDPVQTGLVSDIEYTAPRNRVEEILVETWEKVLGKTNIGINENFFAIGGDSIKTIQIISRMNNAGYDVEMGELFQYPSIAELAPHVRKLQRHADQAAVQGVVPLTPIQRWFFEKDMTGKHHFNQAMMLFSAEGFNKEAIKAVFTKIQEHHDALRMTYKEENGQIIQTNHPNPFPLSLQVYDYQNRENARELIQRKANEIQAGIDLQKGPLMKLGLFRLKDGDRLLIVIHHLVIDGVSWRILFEDIDTLYRQYKKGQPGILPEKTDSFKVWAERLMDYAHSELLLKEKTTWKELLSQEILPLTPGWQEQDHYLEDMDTLTFALDAGETGLLLEKVNRAFGTEINDILLTALGLALKKSMRNEKFLVLLEGHGRVDIFKGININRTVGWFTNLYPMVLNVSYANDLPRQIKEIKETLRRIPANGSGYGILEYLTAEELKREMNFNLKPQILFNYLGQFAADLGQLPFTIAKESVGDSQSPEEKSEYALEITGIIENKQLLISISYNKKQFKPGTIKTLLNHYQAELLNIIRFCSAQPERDLTPADLTYKELSIETLEGLKKQYALKDIYTLTPMQEGILFHSLLAKNTPVYFIQISYRLHGELEISYIEKSLNHLFKRYDILRTQFLHEGFSRPLQVVLKKKSVDFYYEDRRSFREEEKQDKEIWVEKFKEKDRQRSFDLRSDTLMRVSVIRLNEADYEFTWSFHHILMDGWCLAILISECLEIYTSFLEKRKYQLPAVKPYKNYIQWLEIRDKEKSKQYWSAYLEGFEELTGLPKMRLFKSSRQEYKNKTLDIRLTMDTVMALDKIQGRNKVTLNTIIQTIWAIMLGKYNNKQDVVFGAVVSGRPPGIDGIESMVGLFINTIPVRISYEAKMKFHQLVRWVQQSAIESEPHHHYPLAETQAASVLKQHLLDHILVFENYPIADQINGLVKRLPGKKETAFTVSKIEVFEQTNYDFNIIVSPGNQLRVKFKYNANIYETKFVNSIANQFINLVNRVIKNEESCIEELPLLSGEEKQQVLFDFNRTKEEYPVDKPIHRLFEEQVEKKPDHIALTGGGTQLITSDPGKNTIHLTYRKLSQKSDQLASLLREKGIQLDSIVGIMVERSIEMIVGIKAILKAGAAYLPLDPGYPEERLHYMMADSSANLLITTHTLAEEDGKIAKWKDSNNIEILLLDFSTLRPFGPSILPSSHLHLPPAPAICLAYVIYTSGTTGKPKGVMLEHQAVVNLVSGLEERIYARYKKPVSIAVISPYVFDASIKQVFAALLLGHCLYIVSESVRVDAFRLLTFYNKYQIEVSDGTPTHIRLLLEVIKQSRNPLRLAVQHFIIGGEDLPRELVEDFFNCIAKGTLSKNKTPTITNVYGPTECCVDATSYEVLEKNIRLYNHIPLGKPMPNYQVYILGREKDLLPIGVPGELCIGGTGVARGYLNQPQLTAEKFRRVVIGHWSLVVRGSRKINDRGPMTHARLYRTGDLAKWLPKGDLEFLGRKDHQVKIRGMRIELGEIESRLLSYKDIKEAIVTVIDSPGGEPDDQFLCAYIVSRKAPLTNGKATGLREYLSRQLPDYMIPAFFLQLEQMPLTSNGKIDRKALPKPEIEASANYAPPGNAIEQKLLEIWHEILGIDKPAISMDANFFQLGGHSLKAITLVSQIHKELHVKIQLPELIKRSTIKELARYIQGVVKDSFTNIEPVERKEYYALSSAQKRQYLLQQMNLESTTYNMPQAIFLEGALARKKLEKSFRQLIKRHEVLRTSFDMVKKNLVQVVHDNVKFALQYYDLPTEDRGQKTAGKPDALLSSSSVIRQLSSEFIRPFDLSRAPLIRVGLIKIGKEQHILLIDMHHIITDAISMNMSAKEFMALYAGERFPPLRLQYKDYSEWQRSKRQKQAFESQEKYWLNQFKKEPPPLNLPTDFPRPALQSFEGNTLVFELSPKQTRELKHLVFKTKTTLYMVLLAIFNILLSKLSGQEEIVVGTPTAGRRHADLENINGMFVNTLLVRNYPRATRTFLDFLAEIKQRTLEAFENQDFQFEDLVELVAKNRDLSRNPLFDVMFAVQNVDTTEIKIPGLKLKPYQYSTTTSRLDIALEGREFGQHLVFSIEYRTKLFKQGTIERYINYFKRIANAVTREPGTKINQIEIIFAPEKKQILCDFNSTKTMFPTSKTIDELFEQEVKRNPHQAAVSWDFSLTNIDTPGEIGITLTYARLDEQANRLANLLRKKGIKTEVVVGIMVERSIQITIALLAILKAGGAYLPIDFNYPGQRIRFMLTDSNAALLISQENILTRHGGIPFKGQKIDIFDKVLYPPYHDGTGENKNKPQRLLQSSNLAYVIYTSGSTGKPKGVMVEHRNVVRLVKNTNFIDLSAGDRLLLTGGIVFDITTFEIWGPLLNGLQLYLTDQETLLAGERLKKVLRKNCINILHLVPQVFNQLASAPGGLETFTGLDYFMVGGDLVRPRYINAMRNKFKQLKILHMYGPTENTTFSTFYSVDKEFETRIPIGKPISNSSAYVLDSNNKLQPIGIPGELVVGGDGVAQGYLNNPELTAKKFVKLEDKVKVEAEKGEAPREQMPKKGAPPAYKKSQPPNKHMSYMSHMSYIYKTGDLARWLPDGNLEFLGRQDLQIKIRGMRIELEEIENRLLRYEAVKEAVVTAMDRPTAEVPGHGEKYLCAYIVPRKEQERGLGEKTRELSTSTLKEYLSRELPDFMIPQFFVQLENIPLSPNGKIDKKALPAPRIDPQTKYLAPRSRVEQRLVEIWHDVLGIGKNMIGIDTNFFELGGHSLNAAVTASRIHQAFQIKISLTEIFKNPTIRELAEVITGSTGVEYASIAPGENKEYYPLSSAQKRLYILQQMDRDSTAYNIPQVISIDRQDKLEVKKLEEIIKKLIHRHESMSTSFSLVNHQVVQRIHREVQFEIQRLAVPRGSSPESADHTVNSALAANIISNFIQPFDLSQTPLLRVGWIQSEEKRFLLVDMHHIISDGLSHNILAREFQALLEGEALPTLRIQYKDFSQWQNSEKEKEKIKQQETYWLKEFAGDIPVLDLPLDYSRPTVQTFAGNTVTFKIPDQQTDQLKRMALEENTTLYMILLTLYNIFLSKLSSQEDIIVGTPVAGRSHADLEKIIGMFVNTLALRNYSKEDKTLGEFFEEVKERTLEAFDNQDYPFEDLVDRLEVHRDVSRNPLFDVMFALQNIEVVENIDTFDTQHYEHPGSKFDMTLTALDSGQRLFFIITYNTRLFKRKTIERFIAYFKTIISRVLINPGVKISNLEIISESEKKDKISQFNQDLTDELASGTLQEKLLESLKKHSNKTAIDYGPLQLSYCELDRKSTMIYTWMLHHKIKKGSLIGIYLNDKIETISVILGALKARSVFVPIDTHLPKNRIKDMIEITDMRIIFVDAKNQGKLETACNPSDTAFKLVIPDDYFYQQARQLEPINEKVRYNANDKIYIYFTSGTSGTPQAIIGKNQSLLQFIQWEIDALGVNSTFRVSQFTALAFDAFLRDVFTPLCAGGTVCIPGREEVTMTGEQLVQWIDKNNINLVHCVPGLFRVLNSEPLTANHFTSLKYILLSGEEIKSYELKKWYETFAERIQLVNLYGPTETTMVKTFYLIQPGDAAGKQIPIGNPMRGSRIIILDRGMNICPYGITGEIYIKTPYMTFGYCNNPELNSEKFIKPPFGADSTLMYKTGDLGRELEDGKYEFVGRVDRQVKIRGIRIELREIETSLIKLKEIQSAVVLSQKDKEGTLHLCAYFVADRKLLASELREYLSHDLPIYMIPSYFTQLHKIPLNPSGKIDKRKLPAPGVGSAEGEYKAPGNPVEKKLVEMWSGLLGIEKDNISIEANFFELGGHSLKATVLASKIHKVFNVKLPLVEIFKGPTIRNLYQYIMDAARDQYTSIEATEKQEYYPLSSPQKRLFFLQQMDKAGTAYNIPSVWSLEGLMNKDSPVSTFKKLIRRHDSLRTSFRLKDEEPVQQIHEKVEFEIEYYDMKEVEVKVEEERSSVSGKSLEGTRVLAPLPRKSATAFSSNPQPATALIDSFIRPFDLSHAPLLRVRLIKIEEKNYILMVDMHHIISDGVSIAVLWRDFITLYRGENLNEAPFCCKDYAQWQLREKKSGKLREQGRFWREIFEGEVPVIDLPTDYVRPAVQRFEGRRLGFGIDSKMTGILKKTAQDMGSTLYVILLAAYAILLARLSNQEDIVVGAPVAGRRHENLETIIGMFVGTLALRNYPAAEKSLARFLEEVKTGALEAFENQEYQYEDLVEQLNINRDPSRNPLFDVSFVLQNIEFSQISIPGLKVSSWPYESKISKFDLSLVGMEIGEKLDFYFEYSTNLFGESTIHRFAAYYKNIIAAVAQEKNIRLCDIKIIPEQEKKQLLYEFNDTTAPYPAEKTITRLFEEQVQRRADKIAIIGCSLSTGTDRPVFLSYGALNETAAHSASRLSEKGVTPDTVVAVMVERCLEMMVGIFAVFKAGGAYMPVDPAYPAQRIDYLLNDSCAKILLSESSKAGIPTIELKELCSAGHLAHPLAGDPPVTAPENLAYLIYTSGSTGKPKGVMVEHGALVNRLHWMQKQYPLSGSDTILHKTTFTFDVSVWEILWWSLEGASVCLLSPGGEKDPQRIVDAVHRYHVTVMHFVPSMLSTFLEYIKGFDPDIKRLASLKQVIASGEALTLSQVKQFNHLLAGPNSTALANLYGPTEATIDASFYDCPAEVGKMALIPIGKPIDNIKLVVMDKQKRLQPLGVVGELCICGVGLARGYMNRSGLTADMFFEPSRETGFYPPPYLRLYRTGDLARWLPDGNIELSGRIDHQVKIRGFRIELGEIENRLLQFPAVKEAVVTTQKDNLGDPQLVGYVVPDKKYAYPVHRLLKLESQGLLKDLDRHEYDNGMTLFYKNRWETDFMYREIFQSQSYMARGITLDHGACVFDVGANIGVFSLFVIQACKNAKIYAFEPIPPLYQLLSLNASLYSQNIETCQYGIADKEKEALFYYYPHATVLSGQFADFSEEARTVKAFIHNKQAREAGEESLSQEKIDELLKNRLAVTTYTCKLKSLSQVIKEKGVDKIDLLKIDVEKGETDVLKGIETHDWPKIRQIVIEVHNVEGRLEEITHLLKNRGYQVSIQQDSDLQNTDLYNVYALSPKQESPETSDSNAVPVDAPDHRSRFSPRVMVAELKNSLAKQLPQYMVPSFLVLLHEMPLTGSGKIDRKALPEPEIAHRDHYVAPRDEIEKKLVDIWAEVLDMEKEKISITDGFFKLGGHSLKSIILLSRVHKVLNVKIPLAELFKAPSLRAMADYIKTAVQDSYAGVKPVEKKQSYSLSSAQNRLYLQQQLDLDNLGYNTPQIYRLGEDPGKEGLEKTFRQLIERHESFRTSFELVERKPVQRVHDHVDFDLEYFQVGRHEDEKAAVDKIFRDFIRIFDLSSLPLLRGGLIKILRENSQCNHILMVDVHHIVSDGVSVEILIREFFALYKGKKLPELLLQYKDYAEWEQGMFSSGAMHKRQEYWLDIFRDKIPQTDLPANDESTAGTAASQFIFFLTEELSDRIRGFVLGKDITLYMFLIAVLNILLLKYTNQEEILIGTPVFGRKNADLLNIVGMFVNMLPMVNFPRAEKRFMDFLKEIKKNSILAFENQEYPFEQLVWELGKTREGKNRLEVNIVFAVEVKDPGSRDTSDLPITPYEWTENVSKFHLVLLAMEVDHKIAFNFDYNKGLYSKQTIVRMAAHLQNIITEIINNPRVKIEDIKMLGKDEMNVLVNKIGTRKKSVPGKREKIDAEFDF